MRMYHLWALLLLMAGLCLPTTSEAADRPEVPSGPYTGICTLAKGNREVPVFGVFFRQGNDLFFRVSSFGPQKPPFLPDSLKAIVVNSNVTFRQAIGKSEWSGSLAGEKVVVESKGPQACHIEMKLRPGPTLGQKPPEGAIALLPAKPAAGTDPLKEWDFKIEKTQAPSQWPWKLQEDGSLLVEGRKSLDESGWAHTKRTFGDHKVHVEFLSLGNSGVYLHGRYEVQILNSGSQNKSSVIRCGAIYTFRPANVNACLDDSAWQTYDIIFLAPRFESGKKTRNARITVVHNGLKIHDNLELPRVTGGAIGDEGPKGPLVLQEHDDPVRFRNIWVQDL